MAQLGCVVGCVAMISSLSGAAHAQCTMDTDCKADRICENGRCVAPSVATPPLMAPPPASAPLPLKPRLHRRSPEVMIGGIALASAAPLVIVVGSLMTSSTFRECIDAGPGNISRVSPSRFDDCSSSQRTRGYLIVGAAVAMLAAGIPMIVWGAKGVPDRPSAMLTPWAAPREAGLAFTLRL